MSEFDDQQNENYEIYEDAVVEPIQPQKKGFAVASLVLGITALVPGCCLPYIGIVLSILAIVFSVLYTKANKGLVVNKGMALAALILGILGIIVNGVMLALIILSFTNGEYTNIYNRYLQEMQNSMNQ